MRKFNLLIMLLFILYSISIIGQETFQKDEGGNLVYLMEEEKMARDVYQTFGVLWNKQIFKTIAEEEEQHLQLIIDMAKKNEILLPEIVELDFKGKFQNVSLQNLYDDLIKQGSHSFVDALKAAAWIEERDIADLDLAMSNTKDERFEDLYKNLIEASDDHLRVYVKKLANEGIDYKPQILSESKYSDISNGQIREAKCKNKSKNCCQERKLKRKKYGCKSHSL